MAEKDHRVRKKKLGSYPSVSVIFSVTLSLFVIGLFGLLVLHANRLTELIQENIEVQVYLDKNISQNQRVQVLKTLSSKDFVRRKENEAQIRFVSKDEAERRFIEDTGEDFKDFLGENPLRDVYVVNVANGFQQSQHLSRIKTDVEKLPGVYEVVYVDNLVDSINSNLTKVGLLLLGFAVILLIVVVILINNTIKLALFSQRFLIRSMQLVGAKASFIQKPFISRAFLYGVLAGLLATALLYGLMHYANTKIEDLILLQDFDKIIILYGLLILGGALISLLSTYRAVRKYLKLSLDELY